MEEKNMATSENDKKLRRSSTFPYRKKQKHVVVRKTETLKHSFSFTIREQARCSSFSNSDCVDDEKEEGQDFTDVCHDSKKDEITNITEDSIQKLKQVHDKKTLLKSQSSDKTKAEVCSQGSSTTSEGHEEKSSEEEKVSMKETTVSKQPNEDVDPMEGEGGFEILSSSQKSSFTSDSLNNSNLEIVNSEPSPIFTCKSEFPDDSESIMESVESLSESESCFDCFDSCVVCYSYFSDLSGTLIHCENCSYYVCKPCMMCHLKEKIKDGFTLIRCPGDSCTRVISDEEVDQYCNVYVALYLKNKVDAENNPKLRTCPGCNLIHNFTEIDEIPSKHKCSSCALEWCVRCHAPWHTGMSCSKYQKDVVGKGRKALKIWAKCKGKTYPNARKCPSCKFFIERTSGCDHMFCTRCATDFCYRCGKKHREALLLGNHYSRYHFFGCKYNLAENKPALRIAIRSGVLTGTVLALPIAACLLASACAVLVAVSPILLPVVVYKKLRR